MSLEKVTSESFEKVISENKMVVVDCYADWCGPCKVQKPALQSFSQENTEVKAVLLDIENDPDLAKKFGISSIPTLLWFKDGKLAKKSVGLQREDKMKQTLAEVKAL